MHVTAESHHTSISLCLVTTLKQLEIVNIASAKPQACHTKQKSTGEVEAVSRTSHVSFLCIDGLPAAELPF